MKGLILNLKIIKLLQKLLQHRTDDNSKCRPGLEKIKRAESDFMKLCENEII